MAITIFKIEMLPPPPSTKVPLAQNVCYDDIILLWKWDPGTWGGGAFVLKKLSTLGSIFK